MFEQSEHLLIFPYDTADSDSPRTSLFQELLENGMAETHENRVLIPHEEICRLSSPDQRILALPDPYPFEIRIDADGLFQSPDFQLRLRFFEYNHGNQIFGKRTGCVLRLEDGTHYLLSSDQYDLCKAVDAFNALSDKNLPTNLTQFSKIRKLAEKSDTVLDSFLENENILVPENIRLKLEKGEGDTLEILPEIENLKDPALIAQFEEKKFDRFNRIPQTYTLVDEEGNRIRMPLSPAQQDEFAKIKQYRKTDGELRKKLTEKPQDFFDPDVIDLDNFSDRVIQIGFYKPQYFPFISPYESEWIPGILTDDGEEKTRILIRDEQDLTELEAAYEAAVQAGEEHADFRGTAIPTPICETLIEVSKAQLANPGKPLRKTRQSRKVLIIEDNLYEDKYHEGKKQPAPVPETFIHNFRQPPHLRDGIELYEHQKEGIAWMESLLSGGYSGGLLADDMGLGKTLQILSFIDWHDAGMNAEEKPYLIVAPVSLLENWRAEYERFFDNHLRIRYVYGSEDNGITLENLSRHFIFVTNYETMRNPKNQFCFGQIDWAAVVTDEAQRIKTPGTLVTNAIKALKADFKIALTGTPVENSMLDLWCISDFVVPGLLGSAKRFSKKYQNPIRKNISDEALNYLGSALRSEIGLYFKRRLKADVLTDLPDKIEKRRKIPMPDEQKNAYLQEIQVCQEGNPQQILSAILNLKKISDHPCLMGYDYHAESADKLIRSSAKLKATIEILAEIRQNKEKVIIFSEFRETQRILRKVIQEVFGLRHISVLNGEMAAHPGKRCQKETRQGAVDRFSEEAGFNVIIMSPLAAGVGLNVTAANHVIHYSRHWNPAKEAQATDRAYRIGQRKTVRVYYPMAVLPETDTFDVILDNLLLRKRNLADSAMFPSAISEIAVDDFSGKLAFHPAQKVRETPLQTEDLDHLEPLFFEAAIAAIFRKKGFDVILTPKSNDKGADVIALSENRNLLIQVKQSVNPINDKAIGEVLKAKGYYESKYGKGFSLAVASNSVFNSNALIMAENNNIREFDRSDIQKFVSAHPLYFSEIRQAEKERYTQI